jgi:cell division protein FtsB
MPKTVSIVLVLIVVVLILVGLFKQINNALLAEQRLNQAVEEVAKLQDKNKGLKNKLLEVQSQDYIETIARDKLGLSRPNETVVVIPKESLNRVLGLNTKIEEIKLPNWQGWLKLLKINF